ncbi:hypothetical protein COT63_01470 [Candidatus Shapirobacteria bacterium CG09_land_8_20_14_0_10_38_17]|uniref:Methyltransferase type 11 domain-containing protein n=1 Tax=Candidatus Shapirobacteria bacterium CG09_land_8_20_14_0_10_38_17 TaxID=1974884 RepID=A0A2H0WR58_9BACT|nr:MAG: hypothetical protein COT63_01470 [Candidatus Shapirobacteria bacterium CG09_land_8_20_14_0_10_38_17]
MDTYYDFYDYHYYWQNRQYENQAEKIALQKLFKLIPQKKKKNILDVGAGFGRHTLLYAPLFKKVILLEPSLKLLQEAKKNLKNLSNLTFKRGTAQKLPYPEQSVNTVLMIRVIHHLNNLSPIFQEISRVLVPNGTLILEFANKTHFKAKTKAIISGNLTFLNNLAPVDQRSRKNIKERSILFLNHHPKAIEKNLQENNLKIIKKLSVSNFRSPTLKKILPINCLLFLEKITQSILAPLNFGPSIFLLARKTNR